MIAHAGMEQIRAAVRYAFRPEPDLPVWQWAERHVRLPVMESPDYAGPFRTEMTPFIREPLEVYRDDAVRSCAFAFATQACKTLAQIIGTAWWLTHRQGRVIWMMNTEAAVRSFSSSRWQPTVEEIDSLRNLKPRDSDLFKNLEQRFGGSVLNFVGGNSPGSAVSRPADLINADECDLYLGETDTTASVMTMLTDRMKSRAAGKILRVGSPTLETGAVWIGYMEGDQRRCFVPCPHCGAWQILDTERIRWSQEAKRSGQWDLDRVRATAVYECPECSRTWAERHKRDIVEAHEWRPTNPSPYPGSRSYQIGSIYSLWPATSLGALATQYLQHMARFDLRAWDNSWRGMPHRERGDRIEAGELEGRLIRYDAPIPAPVVGLTVGVDTQDDRLEAEILGWAPGEEQYSIDFRVFWGDPDEAHVWAELDAWLLDPRPLGIDVVFVDVGGHRADAVLRYARARSGRRVYACKGSSTLWSPVIAAPKPSRNNKLRAPVWMIGTDTAKGMLLSRFKLESGPGACWWPAAADGRCLYGQEYLDQLAGEELRTRYQKGREVRYWYALRPRVEALDCRVYAFAARHILPQDIWEQRRRAGHGVQDTDPTAPQTKPKPQPKHRPRRGWARRI